MAAAHKKSGKFTEIERKFDVDETAVTPSFDGLTSVAQVDALPVQTLDAVYYDTAGHDLARHRITLRRRTGGVDAGWHLKLPAGDNAPDARTEIRLPLDGAGDVPADLRDIVLALQWLELPFERIDAGAAFELLQAFALIHDDVMDGADRRRGVQSIFEIARLDELPVTPGMISPHTCKTISL